MKRKMLLFVLAALCIGYFAGRRHYKYETRFSMHVVTANQEEKEEIYKSRVLDPPPIATSDPQSVEVMRVWASPGSPQQVTINTTWKDPAVWGLMLVDIAKHAAKAYAREGHDEKVTLNRIVTFYEKEWNRPTDEPEDISDAK